MNSMKMSGGPASLNIKVTLLVVAIIIAGGSLYFTNSLASKLQQRERQIVQLYASSLEYIASPTAESFDITFIFEKIVKRIDFPLILTDADDHVIYQGSDLGVRNLEIDSTLNEEERIEFLNQKVKELGAVHDPITVTYDGETVWRKIYYGNSEIVKSLHIFPYFQIIVVVLFVLISYFSFSYMKRNEQSNVWVGMAKETAHQLGTPISSLMGWNEMLKIYYESPDKVLDTSEEIDNDLVRLNKVANRFSKIGSQPELKDENLYEVIERVKNYFYRRLPQSARDTQLIITGPEDIRVKINVELFEWVLENLVKNALDAIDHPQGEIEFILSESKDTVELEVQDNGKGIPYKKRKDIFRPGYSTKRRGWGLGLSLTKRIVEEYHKGKIFVKDSMVGKGTTFKIVLKKSRI